jgi:diguanylate cyclase (GGDEF)-like protein
MSEKVLVIEDSKLLASLLKKSIELSTGLVVDHASDYTEAQHLLEANEYFVAVTVLNLPGANEGGMVDYLIDAGVPTVVYTGDYSDDLRGKIWKKRIVDYVLKRDPDSSKYICDLIKQLMQNRNIDVVVVDDSIIMRNNMKKLLETHLFRVHTCVNARAALDKINDLENLKLVISDYMMPDMDGFSLAREIRKKHAKDKVAFIGISGSQSEQISAKFIKFGATDFMAKPFSHEQFYSRVTQNLQTILMIENIRDLSFKDYLTGLYNRRYFFIEMESVFDINKESTVCLMDIDFFKKVNDTYGHDGGDVVLVAFSNLLKEIVGDDGIVIRFGGEEFCIYFDHVKDAKYFENIRERVQAMDIHFDEMLIKVTSSFGVVSTSGKEVQVMITDADNLLYDAKASGRNKVCYKS